MAVTKRARTVSNDNIAVGSASGTERIISGAAAPAEKVGGKDNLAVGVAFPTTVIADNHTVGVAAVGKERLTP